MAGLYVDALIGAGRRTITSSHLEQLLGTLPEKLYDFYGEILGRIKDGYVKQEAFKALSWVMFAARPLWLEELVEACATLPEAGVLFNEEVRPHSIDLVEPLAGLVHVEPSISETEYDEGEPKLRTYAVTLAHFSVREYLQQLDVALWAIKRPLFRSLHAQQHISQACFAYLVHFRNSPTSSTPQRCPMMEYALSSWSSHVAACLQNDEQTLEYRELSLEALSLRVKNTISLPDIELYDDRERLQSYALCIAREVLNGEEIQYLSQCIQQRNTFGIKESSHQTAHKKDNSGYVNLENQLSPTTFRLIILHPDSNFESSINCSLMIESLENKPRYSFLSYLWDGSKSNKSFVYIDGQRFSIHQQPFHALMHIRHQSNPLILWVDSLCINLSNYEERSHQVGQMGSVVKYATETIVWLGNLTYSTAFDIFRAHSRGKRVSFTFDRKESVLRFLDNPYWRRVWVVQEILLAREVRIQQGRMNISWDDMMHFLADFDRWLRANE